MKARRTGWVEARRCHGYDVQTPICSFPGGEELPEPSAQFDPGWSLYPDSNSPVIGASGAIAFLMGSYLVQFPEAKIL